MTTVADLDREQLIRDHIWLLKRIAWRWTGPTGIAVHDLIADGFLGLRQAADRFDGRAGIKFSTYATPRINGAIRDALREQDRYTRSDRRLVSQLTRARGQFLGREGRLPNRPELAAEVGWTVAELERAQARLNRAEPVYLDAPLALLRDDDKPRTLADLLADHAPSVERELCAAARRAEVRRLVALLPVRERAVVCWYFWEDMTLREIAPLLGVTESRVSQILSKACKRLRELAPPDLQEAA